MEAAVDVRRLLDARKGFALFLGGLLAASCLLLAISALRGASPKLLTGDGNACYSWLPTLLIDGDLDFRDDLRDLYAPDSADGQYMPTPRGTVATKCPIGVALVELPGFLVGHAIARAVGAPADGVSMPYQCAVAAWLLALFGLGFVAFFAALLRFGVRAPVALAFTAMEIGATNLLHYVAKEPAMPHAVNVTLVNVFVWVASRRGGIGADAVGGLLMGWLLICRNATGLLIPWLVTLLPRRRRTAGDWMALAAGIALPVLLNAWAFRHVYGQWTFRTYGDEGFQPSLTGLFGCLLGVRHGLFLFNPWYLVLLVLTVLGVREQGERRSWFLAAMLSFALLWAFNGTWWCWWFGASYGNRAFVESLPMLTLCGAAAADRRLGAWPPRVRLAAAACAGALVAANLYLWGGYLLLRYPADGSHSARELFLWAGRGW
jgi:hypothetical protein